MNILAIDTTCKIASCALVKDTTLIDKTTLESEKTHSETMLFEIDKLLNDNGYSINDIDMFALAVGPGSFTGVRIGVALIKGLAFDKNIPCVGVSTITALAENVTELDDSFIVCPIMDARRNQVYNGLYRVDNHNITKIVDDRLISLEELYSELDNYKDICFTGDGCKLVDYNKVNYKTIDSNLQKNNAYSVAKVAYKKYNETEDKTVFSDLKLQPFYLRASQAERDYKNSNGDKQ